MLVIKDKDGNYYVNRVPPGGKMGGGKRTKRNYRNNFLVKCKSHGNQGVIPINSIIFPNEFIGKWIRLKVEKVYNPPKVL